MGSELRTVYRFDQADIFVRAGGDHPGHRFYAELGALRACCIDDLPYLIDCQRPKPIREIVAVSAVPARAIGSSGDIDAAGGTDGIRHPELADGVVGPTPALGRVGGERIAPDADLGDAQAGFVGCGLVGHDRLLAGQMVDREDHSFQAKCLVFLGPFPRRAVTER